MRYHPRRNYLEGCSLAVVVLEKCGKQAILNIASNSGFKATRSTDLDTAIYEEFQSIFQ